MDVPEQGQISSISAKVKLLIGTNAPKLLEPWEVINSRGEGPYAVGTPLGWVVNGPLRNSRDDAVSVASLEELLISKYKREFSEL